MFQHTFDWRKRHDSLDPVESLLCSVQSLLENPYWQTLCFRVYSRVEGKKEGEMSEEAIQQSRHASIHPSIMELKIVL
jgi:hypothetical protein